MSTSTVSRFLSASVEPTKKYLIEQTSSEWSPFERNASEMGCRRLLTLCPCPAWCPACLWLTFGQLGTLWIPAWISLRLIWEFWCWIWLVESPWSFCHGKIWNSFRRVRVLACRVLEHPGKYLKMVYSRHSVTGNIQLPDFWSGDLNSGHKV